MGNLHKNNHRIQLVLFLLLNSVVRDVTSLSDVGDGTTLPNINIMGFLPMTGDRWPGGGACLPGIEIAIRMANERADILAEYNLQFLFKDDKCDPGVATNNLYEMLYEPPVKHFISGPGCSNAAEATARSSHMWNLTHLSWGGSSPLLSNVQKYPRFFRIGPDAAFYNTARVAILRLFNWKKVATINVALDFFFAITDDFLERIEETDIQIISQEIFNGDPMPRVKQLKALDVRIIFAGGYENHAREILCAAYKCGLYGDKIVWVFPNFYRTSWWRLPGVTCTSDEMEEIAAGIIQLGRFSVPKDKEAVGSSGINFIEFQERFYGHPLYKPEHSTYDRTSAGCFDATWGAALALNCTDAELKKQGHEKNLSEFTYSDVDIADVVTECTNNLQFVGVVGRTDLTNHYTEKAVKISQIHDGEDIIIGNYDKLSDDVGETEWQLTWVNGGIHWRGGYVPRDSTHFKTVEVTVPTHMYALMSGIASLGILLSLTLIVFNVYYRENKYVKLSSPNINTILLLGCVCTYSTVFMKSYTSETILLCKVRPFTFSLGFSIAFGALFSKTWRVYRIFCNKQMSRLNIQDRQLIGIVGALVAVLSTVHILKEIIDPVTIETTVLQNEVYLVGIDEEIRPYIRVCVSQYESYFSWTIYLIMGVLLIFGAFLSFETRRVSDIRAIMALLFCAASQFLVKIAALNDSRLIGLCLYNVIVLAAIGVTLNLALDTQVALIYGITSGFTIFGTTATQLIVFIPKIMAVFYPHHIEPDTGAMGNQLQKATTLTKTTSNQKNNPHSSEAMTPRDPTR